MLQYLKVSAPQQIAADTLAVSSGSATAFAWLANVNEVLQFIALAVAITSGYYAARYHRRKNNELGNDKKGG